MTKRRPLSEKFLKRPWNSCWSHKVTNSEVDKAETTSKADKADTTLQTRDVPSQASKPGDTPSASGISQHGHQSQLYTTDEETGVAAETLESLQGTDDLIKTPPGEEDYFEGSGLQDHICHSQVKKKGHSHQTIQQSTADTPTSSMMSVPIKMVPPAKVIIDDMVNLSLRLGSPNPLMMAIEGDHLSGPADLKDKRQQWPPDTARALVELPSKIGRRKTEFPMTGSSKPTRNQPKALQVTVFVSGESDFTAGIHQVIPSEPCYSPPLGANASGGLKMGYDNAVQVIDFQGMYYFESGCLWPSYMNSMLYDHPLDWQGYIASTPHSGTAAYSSYISLSLLVSP